MRYLLVFVLVAMLAGCGHKLSGTYADEDNIMSLTFNKNGKVLMGSNELDYEVDGDLVKLKSPMGTQVMHLQSDGTIRSDLLNTTFSKSKMISKTYVSADRNVKVKFKSDGTAILTEQGQDSEWKYEFRGQKIHLENSNKMIALRVNDSGNLTGNNGLTLFQK